MLPYIGLHAQRKETKNALTQAVEARTITPDSLVWSSMYPNWFIFYVDSLKLPNALKAAKLNSAGNNFVWGATDGTLRISLLDSMSGRILRYNASGLISQKPQKEWSDTITVTNGNAFVQSISSAGFTKITDIQAVGCPTGNADANAMLNVEIKSFTTSSVTLNVTKPNALVSVALIGLNVNTGSNFATNVKVALKVSGY